MVLITLDSAPMRRVYRSALVERGVAKDDIIEAADGNAALTLAQREVVSLFLLDWDMQGLDGIGFVKTVRGIRRYAATPIVMMTSSVSKTAVMEAIRAGVTGYLVKPVTPEALWKRIAPYV